MNTRTRTSPDTEAKLYEIIREIETGMLTTVRPDHSLHTRPMVTRFDQNDGDLWFFTLETAPKADEIEQDRHVSIGYADAKKHLYATVSGTASMVHEPARQSRLWTPSLLAWFPRGPDDPDLALLRVKIRTAEYWDAPSKTMVEIIAAVQAGLDNPPPINPGDHAAIDRR